MGLEYLRGAGDGHAKTPKRRPPVMIFFILGKLKYFFTRDIYFAEFIVFMVYLAKPISGGGFKNDFSRRAIGLKIDNSTGGIMNDECMKGAYRGVPYSIFHDGDAPWDLTDPRMRIADVVVLCYGRDGHVNYGADQEELSENALRKLVTAKMATIIKNSSNDPKGYKITEAEYTEREDGILFDLSEALEHHNMESLKELLDWAEVDYRAKELTGHCQGQHCETLYFFEEGRKFTAEDEKVYRMEMEGINLWVWGLCYGVQVGNECCSGFLVEDYADLEDNNPLSDYIKQEIDALFKKRKGAYTVVGDYARAVCVNGTDKLEFDKSQQVKIYLDREEDAKEIAGAFKHHAIVVDNTKDHQK